MYNYKYTHKDNISHISIFITRRNQEVFEVLVDHQDWLWIKNYALNIQYHYNSYRVCIHYNGLKLLHKVILEVEENLEVDHINGNSLDNRRLNLRSATRLENANNRHKVSSNNTSGVRGVTWNGRDGNWRAQLTVNKQYYSLGLHSTVEEAAEAIKKFKESRI